MEAIICARYKMTLPETSNSDKWWYRWAVSSPRHAGDHLTVSLKTFEAIQNTGLEFSSIHEYFGGIGAHALMLDDLFHPWLRHTVADYSPEAVAHLDSVVSPSGTQALQADAYDANNTTFADLVVMDFGDLTVFQAQPGKARGDLLDRVFMLEPQAVTITDIAARYLHLQKRSYEPILGPGACDSYEEYLERYAEHLSTRYGYTLLEGNYTRWSCVMAFVAPGVAPQGSFHKLPPGGTPGLVINV